MKNKLNEVAVFEQFVNALTEATVEALKLAPIDKKMEVIKYYEDMYKTAQLRFYLGTLR